MPNIKLTLEYNGEKFHGWQKQPNLRTIQEELEKALNLVFGGGEFRVHASGRTDAGVHAKAQVVNFNIEEDVDLSKLQLSLSGILKGELAVIKAEEVPVDFHC